MKERRIDMKKVLRKITSMMLVLSMAMGFAVPAIAVEATEESPSQIVSTGGVTYYAADGSAGTADPLNQRASAGWKATKTAERLVENYMIRIESCSTFADEYAN